MSGARQKNKRAEKRARIVASAGGGRGGGESAARQEEANSDERGSWERRESRLHHDVEREVRERKENVCPSGGY